MGIFESIFRKPKRERAVRGYFQTLNGYQPVFTSFEGGVYEAIQTRAAIHAFASHVSKLKPEVVGAGNPRLAQILAYKPNPFMSTSQFLYRVATIFAATNNAFIVPIEDDYGRITGYYPLAPNRVEAVNCGGMPYLRYTFANGQKAAIELEKACILTQMQFRNDLFGESNDKVLDPTMQAMHAQNQGMIEGIKAGGAVRFLAKLANVYNDDTIREERQRFREEDLAVENQGGVMLIDAKFDEVKQIDSKPFLVDADQMKLINENVNNYFGVNQEIMQNKFNEETANAFYEGKIEPFAVQLGLGMTNMTYSEHQKAFGNEIMFSANRLQYATTTAKLLVSQQLFDRGILSQNDVCDIWQLPHIEGGDRRFIRGEYVNTRKEKDGKQLNIRPLDEKGEDDNAQED